MKTDQEEEEDRTKANAQDKITEYDRDVKIRVIE